MQANILDTIDIRELGKELQKARKQQGLTQEDAAKIIDVARTTITAIEKGERRIKADELSKLAHAYNRQVSDFVRSRPQVEPFQVQFRGPYMRTAEDNQAIAHDVATLEALCRDYLELEQITGSPLVRKYPPEYTIAGLRIEQEAESVAIEERQRLGLGDAPIGMLRDMFEQRIGLRIFYFALPSKFSAMYFYNDQLGGCIAINRHHPEERRRWSLAHEYSHFLVDRHQPNIFVEDGYRRLPESDRFADAFARYFLMPTSSLTRQFNDLLRMKTRENVTLGDLCTIAYDYGVSVTALVLRLEEMKLVPTGTWDKLRERGVKVREVQQKRGLGAIPARDDMLPIRYQYLAIEAFDRELISEGQFARFLRVDRLEARQITEIVRGDTGKPEEGLALSPNLTQDDVGGGS